MNIPKSQQIILKSQLALSQFALTASKDFIVILDELLTEIDSYLKQPNADDIFTRQNVAAIQSILANHKERLFSDLRNTASQTALEARRVAGLSMVQAGHIRPPVDLDAALQNVYTRPHDALTWSSWSRKLGVDLNHSLAKTAQGAARRSTPVKDVRLVLSSRRRRFAGASTALASTLITHQSNAARLEAGRLFGRGEANYVRYAAILDNRTSFQCAGLDGTIWEAGESNVRVPPIHPNCRSTLLFFSSLEEAEEFPRATFSEYLKAQDADFQREYLGPSRYNLYRKRLPLHAFSSEGTPLTLEQLRLRYPHLADQD